MTSLESQHVAYCPSQEVWDKVLAATGPASRGRNYPAKGGGIKVLGAGFGSESMGDRNAGPGLDGRGGQRRHAESRPRICHPRARRSPK